MSELFDNLMDKESVQSADLTLYIIMFAIHVPVCTNEYQYNSNWNLLITQPMYNIRLEFPVVWSNYSTLPFTAIWAANCMLEIFIVLKLQLVILKTNLMMVYNKFLLIIFF